MKPTICDSCRRAEMTPWQRLREDIANVFRRPDMIGMAARSNAAMIRAMQGKRQLTNEEMHRERWIRTGDEVELRRMLRHQGDLQ